MKRYVVLFGILALSIALITPNAVRGCSHDLWALIISGYPDLDLDPNYLYTVLSEHYSFSGIKLLAGYPNNKQTVRNAISSTTGWLRSRSDSDDLIFIFVMSHGGGYNSEKGKMEGGRVDGSQGDPIDELDGVDECIVLEMYDGAIEESYWDDEVKADLATLSYGRLIFFYEGCKVINETLEANETLSCFSGGFIRDLSAPNRIIITSSNETGYSYVTNYPETSYQYGFFSRQFIRALDKDGYVDPKTGEWVDSFGLADITKDGKVSMREAFEYAWHNDKAFWGFWSGFLIWWEWIQETPQLDDNGDGISSYPYGQPNGDGYLSLSTYFGEGKYFIGIYDLNLDGYVDMKDISLACIAYGTSPGDPKYNIRAAVVVDDPPFDLYSELVTMRDIAAIARAFGTDYRGELAC